MKAEKSRPDQSPTTRTSRPLRPRSTVTGGRSMPASAARSACVSMS